MAKKKKNCKHRDKEKVEERKARVLKKYRKRPEALTIYFSVLPFDLEFRISSSCS